MSTRQIKRLKQQLQEFQEQEVKPLHLACTAQTTFDTFPKKSDGNFTHEYGEESTAAMILQNYLQGENEEG